VTEPKDRHVLRDPSDDAEDWAWRRRIRANPTTLRAYRIVVGVVGLVLVAGGLVLVPLPGPGWLIVIIGIAVWASEFEPAARLLDFVKDNVRRWDDWVRAAPRWVQALVALATFLLVCAVLWAVFRMLGIPGFLPDGLTAWLHDNAGL
jgi:uncharacterized protein (TIGR02611 family)